MGPQVRFTTHDDVIRISTINTPRSAGGVQYVRQAGGSNYFGAVTPATGAARPPQPAIKPLYERTIGTRRLTVGAYRGYLGLCLSPSDPADIYYKPRPLAPRVMPGVNFSHTAFLYQRHLGLTSAFWSCPSGGWWLAPLSFRCSGLRCSFAACGESSNTAAPIAAMISAPPPTSAPNAVAFLSIRLCRTFASTRFELIRVTPQMRALRLDWAIDRD